MTWGSRPVSVAKSLRTTLFSLILVVVATSLFAHDFFVKRHSEARRQQAALHCAQALAQRINSAALPTDADLSTELDGFLESPFVLAAAVFDETGTPVIVAAVSGELERTLRTGWEQATSSPRCFAKSVEIPEGVVANPAPVDLVFTSIRPWSLGNSGAEAGFLIQFDPGSMGNGSGPWSFETTLGFVALLSLFGAWWRLRRTVTKPLESLAELATSEAVDADAADRFRRHAELGQTARTLIGLKTDLRTAQHRAHIVERRVKSRIAKETRRISRDLARVRREGWIDPLTGTGNRRFLEEKFPAIFDAQRACGQNLAVVMLDLDHFKLLNDTQGHAAGDEILRFLGELLRRSLRRHDFVVRYGGDEFVLILPGVQVEDVVALTRRIMTLFAQRVRMMVDLRPAPTLTAGIAGIDNNNPTDHVELLAFADAELMDAKRSGRSKVLVSNRKNARRRAFPRSGALATRAHRQR